MAWGAEPETRRGWIAFCKKTAIKLEAFYVTTTMDSRRADRLEAVAAYLELTFIENVYQFMLSGTKNAKEVSSYDEKQNRTGIGR